MPPEPNRLLRRAREAALSPNAPGDGLSRADLTEAVNAYLWNSTGKRYDLDAHHIAKWERGAVRCPSPAYRSALRAILGANSDTDLGFPPALRSADTPTPPSFAAFRSHTRDYSGTWHSRYVYPSTSRGQDLEDEQHLIIEQTGTLLMGRTVPHATGSQLSLELVVDDGIATGS